MDEYISKTKFEELMRKKARSNFDLYYVDKAKHYHDKAIEYNIAADEAHDFPTADVQPVKYGLWICEFYNDVFDVYQADCSVCKKESTDKYDKVSESYEYCPHCRARMDGDVNG